MAIFLSLLFGVTIFAVLYNYMQKIFEWLKFQSIGTRDYVVDKLTAMFYDVTPNKVLLWMVLASAVPFTLVFLLLLPKVIPGLLFGSVMAVIGWKVPKPIVNMMMAKRIEKFNLQMVDGLSLMSNAMKSGLSVPQALGVVVEQMPEPMSQEFNLVLSENKVGVSLEEAFENLNKRVQCEDVDMFVTAINILKETGGNLAETFDTIAFVIRERIKVENKIKALTAQGYYQGLTLLSVPILLGAYFMLTEPGFMDPMFESPIGWAIFAAVAVLEIVAYFMIKKVIQVDV